MFCQKCGSEMSDDAAFCGRCGAKVASPHAAAHSNTVSAAAAVKPEAAKPEMRPTEMRKSVGLGGWLWRFAFVVPILGIGYSVMRDGLPELRDTKPEAAAHSDVAALGAASAAINVPQPESSSAEPISVPQQSVLPDTALRKRCISTARKQGYRSGQCAHAFIDACIRTQSRQEMEAVLLADAMAGIGEALSCPNMSSVYVAEFDKF